MGAFWHLFVPVAIGITMDKEESETIAENDTALPKPFAKDFFEVERREWSREHKFLGTRHKVDITYMLSDQNIAQIKPFLNEAWQLIEAEDSSIIPEGLNKFKSNLSQLSISRASLEKMDERLRDIEDNYYLRYESISSTVVYHGWPNELYSDSRNDSMGGFIFLHSYEKMDLVPEETVLFFNLSRVTRHCYQRPVP